MADPIYSCILRMWRRNTSVNTLNSRVLSGVFSRADSEMTSLRPESRCTILPRRLAIDLSEVAARDFLRASDRCQDGRLI